MRTYEGSGRQLFPVRTPDSVTEITKLCCNRSSPKYRLYKACKREPRNIKLRDVRYRSETATDVWPTCELSRMVYTM